MPTIIALPMVIVTAPCLPLALWTVLRRPGSCQVEPPPLAPTSCNMSTRAVVHEDTENPCAVSVVSIQMGSCFFLGTSVDPPSPAAERKGAMWKRREAYSAFCEWGDSTETGWDTQFHRGSVRKGLLSPRSSGHPGRGLAPENWC